MKILAISGSIRSESSNAAVLKAVQKIMPDKNTKWVDFKISDLPFFDPELQFHEATPQVARDFRNQASDADFILISTPEYAHGIPGILKNALEWLICEETMKKKVIVFVASPSGGDYVKQYLLETLKTMDLIAGEEMTLVLRSARQDISKDGEILNPKLKAEMTQFLTRIYGKHITKE